MNNETKNFFERLAGVGGVDNNEEAKSPVSKLNGNNNGLGDIFEETEGQLAIDVYQTPTSFVIESAIAGVKPDDIDISISPESVTVRGKREKEEKLRGDDYLYQECYWGKFSRSVILPQEIDPDRAQASLKNGVLKLVLPKVNKARSKKIKVRFE